MKFGVAQEDLIEGEYSIFFEERKESVLGLTGDPEETSKEATGPNLELKMVPASKLEPEKRIVVKTFKEPPPAQAKAVVFPDPGLPADISIPGYDTVAYRDTEYDFDADDLIDLVRVPKAYHPVAETNVSVNLMWVSKYPNTTSKYLVDGLEGKSFEESIQHTVVKWMLENPKAELVIWYDSEMNTEEQKLATEAKIKELAGNLKKHTDLEIEPEKLVLKDLRSIPLVEAFPDAFDLNQSIYKRVDLLRLVAANHTLSTDEGKTKAFVYADWTVNPFSFKQTFPYGMVDDGFMGIRSSSSAGFENSLMVLGNNNPYTLAAWDDFVTVASARIAKEKHVVDSKRKWFKPTVDGSEDQIIYEMSQGVLLDARARELTGDQTRLVVADSAAEIKARVNNRSFWEKAENFVKNKWSYPRVIKSKGSSENFISAGSFVPSIDHENVSITRVSSHGSTGVRVKSPVPISEFISDKMVEAERLRGKMKKTNQAPKSLLKKLP